MITNLFILAALLLFFVISGDTHSAAVVGIAILVVVLLWALGAVYSRYSKRNP